MRFLLSGVFSFSCASIATAALFLIVTTSFLSAVALWRTVMATTEWPGPMPSALYLLLLGVVPFFGATYLGRAVYAWLDPVEGPQPRLTSGTLLGFAAWLITAVLLVDFLWK